MNINDNKKEKTFSQVFKVSCFDRIISVLFSMKSELFYFHMWSL